uniref:Uncharacterized protein n=1 Tax=Meloidogyne enterolobii TaxID=390850 RepID=A0A6V7UE47_MELEN|nr:unnamed protein product [Meloidogyne enterolobii]
MAPARRLQFQLLLPAVYNFNSSCQTSTTSPAPSLMVPRPRHGTLMTPGPNMVLYCLHLLYKTLLYPTISKSDPNCHSPIRPGQNVTPQFVPDKMSLPNSSRTKCHSPVRPRQNVTPQFVPTKCHSQFVPEQMSLPNSSRTKLSLPNSSRTKLSLPSSPRTKLSLPNRPGQNVTPQFVPLKNPAPKNGPHYKLPTLKIPH